MHYDGGMNIETNTDPFTEEQWWAMCDSHIGRPEPLAADTMPDVWVYYRPWGIMHVPFGWHQRAMATLYAFHHGRMNHLDFPADPSVPRYRAMETYADRFLLEIEGTAFRSSAGEIITAGSHAQLDARERQAFRRYTIRYLED
jgi:hypothetical protein